MIIKLSSVKNIRDFSEFGFKDHIRSAHLHKMNTRDRKTLLKNHNIKTVVDLRTTKEITEKPDAHMPGVNYIHIPIFDESMPGISHEYGNKLMDLVPDMPKLYRSLVTEEAYIGQIKKVMKIINDPNRDGAVLWHCTEGKDRCGIISALFLLSHGIDTETVMNDYLATNVANRKKAQRFFVLVKMLGKDSDFAGKVRDAFLAKREYMEPVMDKLVALSAAISE